MAKKTKKKPAKKKKATAKKGKKKAPAKRAKKAARGDPRACGACGKRGHNKRSHDPGGKLA